MFWGHSKIEMGILKTLRRFMGTLDTFNSWAYRDFEHIGEIQKHFEHIQMEIGDIHEDIGDIGHIQI